MWAFGKGKAKPDPKEMVSKWRKGITKEMRGLDRSIRKIEIEEKKIQIEIKKLAKEGSMEAAPVGLSKSAKTKTQILMSKAQMNSVSNELRNQLSTLRIAGAMQASSAVMETMSNMICVPEMMETMRDMSVEMEKMGLIQEMAEDAFSVIEPDDLSDEDEEVQDAVNAIFAELLPQAAAPTPAAAVAATPAPAQPAAAAADINPLLLDLPSVPTTQLPSVPGPAEPELSSIDQDLAARIAALAN
eukprot:gene3268-22134_t